MKCEIETKLTCAAICFIISYT